VVIFVPDTKAALDGLQAEYIFTMKFTSKS